MRCEGRGSLASSRVAIISHSCRAPLFSGEGLGVRPRAKVRSERYKVQPLAKPHSHSACVSDSGILERERERERETESETQ